MLKHTPFYDFHVSAGARMVDYSGWEMPLMYRSVVDEHQQTRNSGSIFDVSHMGRLHFSGSDTRRFLNLVLTRPVDDMVVGQSRYALVCNESGGVLDDIIVSRDNKHYLMVCNAGNREKLIQYFTTFRRAHDLDFDLADQTESTGMVALQGPKVIERLAGVLPVDVKAIKRYHFETAKIMLIKLSVFRSGYTGEDGIEIILPAMMAGMAMKMLAGKMDKENATLKPAGLAARDTLRLEAGMPLYGHELDENIDPISAGLKWAVNLESDFVGVQKLREIAAQGPKRVLVGLELEDRRIARQGTALTTSDGAPVGQVTSGTFSPTLQKSIAMAFVDVDHSAIGTQLSADLKGSPSHARIVKLPFYKRSNP